MFQNAAQFSNERVLLAALFINAAYSEAYRWTQRNQHNSQIWDSLGSNGNTKKLVKVSEKHFYRITTLATCIVFLFYGFREWKPINKVESKVTISEVIPRFICHTLNYVRRSLYYPAFALLYYIFSCSNFLDKLKEPVKLDAPHEHNLWNLIANAPSFQFPPKSWEHLFVLMF